MKILIIQIEKELQNFWKKKVETIDWERERNRRSAIIRMQLKWDKEDPLLFQVGFADFG